jgi:hypothetical protein
MGITYQTRSDMSIVLAPPYSGMNPPCQVPDKQGMVGEKLAKVYRRGR